MLNPLVKGRTSAPFTTTKIGGGTYAILEPSPAGIAFAAECPIQLRSRTTAVRKRFANQLNSTRGSIAQAAKASYDELKDRSAVKLADPERRRAEAIIWDALNLKIKHADDVIAAFKPPR
jgi:hypothetical protein